MISFSLNHVAVSYVDHHSCDVPPYFVMSCLTRCSVLLLIIFCYYIKHVHQLCSEYCGYGCYNLGTGTRFVVPASLQLLDAERVVVSPLKRT
mgnify:CR=1 FL=1